MANENLPLFSDLQREVVRREKAGNRNYVFAYSLHWLSIVSSMLAAILSAVGTKALEANYHGVTWNLVIAALAAFPVATSSALSAFRVREKVDWYWGSKTKVESLLLQLRDDPTANATDISKKLAELRVKLYESFPGFGNKNSR